MEKRQFGKLGEVSVVTLGGGGIGQVWGSTTREESVATVRQAVESGITFLDVAPSYGNGESESVIGHAFEGRLPAGIKISTKSHVGRVTTKEVAGVLESSLNRSLSLLRLEYVDLFFLHGKIIADNETDKYDGTTRSIFVEAVIPTFEKFIAQGRIGFWGISGVGVPTPVMETIEAYPRPQAVQVVANLLDSIGDLRSFEGPAHPRKILEKCREMGLGVMGIRAVQAGALTDQPDRLLADTNPENIDFHRAAPYRQLASEMGESPASIAHRYSLSMDGVSTVVLGVKNRSELKECITAAEKGPLSPEDVERIDRLGLRSPIG